MTSKEALRIMTTTEINKIKIKSEKLNEFMIMYLVTTIIQKKFENPLILNLILKKRDKENKIDA